MNALHHSPDLRQLPFLGQPSREGVARFAVCPLSRGITSARR
jgi:hypothetical protein